jgi:excisionase family DNA binding protein
MQALQKTSKRYRVGRGKNLTAMSGYVMKLLSVEASAEVLDVSRQTVTRMISDGSLPGICIRAGKRQKTWRIRSEALEKWIMQKERETQRVVKVASNE